MLPSPMAFSPFSSSSSNRNLRTMATFRESYLSQIWRQIIQIQMGQQLLKTPQLPICIYLIVSALLCLTNNHQDVPTSPLTICDNINNALQINNETELQTLLEDAQKKIYEPCFLELVPKYYWAQNMTHIMVKFEFLNSGDTSACERVLSVQKTAEHNHFQVCLICLQSSLIIRYRIKVVTLMPLNYYHAVWKTAEQNTIILQCLKSPSPYFWKTLYLPKQAPDRKPKIWWKIMEKYMQNLKKFIYDLQVEEEEEDISGYVKQRHGKIRNTKLAEIYNPHSQKYLYCNQNNPFELGSWVL